MRALPVIGLVLLGVACRDATGPQFTGTCRSYQSIVQTIPNRKVTTVSFDHMGCGFATPEKLTLPPGTFTVDAQMAWAVNNVGARGMCLFVNGVVFTEDGRDAMQNNAGTLTHVSATVMSDGTAQVWITGTHTSGGNLQTLVGSIPNNVLTYVQVTRVR